MTLLKTAFQRHFSNEGENSGEADLPRSGTRDLPSQKAVSEASGAAPAHHDFVKDTETEMTKRLELLERRFLEPPHHIARNSCDSGSSHHSFTFDQSGTATFRSSTKPLGSRTPSTRNGKLRTKRGRSSTSSPSMQILENVADQHMKKISQARADSPHSNSHDHSQPRPLPLPQDSISISRSKSAMHSSSATYNPVFSPPSASTNSNNRSHSMSSNQTLITAHVTKRIGHGHSSGSTSVPATEAIVAESPPITTANKERNIDTNKPRNFARSGATPRVARSILGDTNSSATTPATPISNSGKTITPTLSRVGSKRKNSVPTKLIEKKRQRNLRFQDGENSKGGAGSVIEAVPSSSLTSTSTPATKATNKGTTIPITPLAPTALPSNVDVDNSGSISKGSLSPVSASSGVMKGQKMESGVNPHISAVNAIGNQKIPANMLITKFFSTNQKSSKRKASKASSIKEEPNSIKRGSGGKENTNDKIWDRAKTHANDESLLQEIALLKSTISSLTESLNEKSAQLKAVSNNQTIIHSQLKKALQDRDQEIKALKEDADARTSKMRDALEMLIRKESEREHAELRQKLASNGARLGRWVYNWVGMRRETVWEDGTAMKACDKKRDKLKQKRDALEHKLKEESKGLEGLDAMEKEEFGLSIRVQLDELERMERALKAEEDALFAEKNAHKLALKQVTNEDYSKFKSMPKVSFKLVIWPNSRPRSVLTKSISVQQIAQRSLCALVTTGKRGVLGSLAWI